MNIKNGINSEGFVLLNSIAIIDNPEVSRYILNAKIKNIIVGF